MRITCVFNANSTSTKMQAVSCKLVFDAHARFQKVCQRASISDNVFQLMRGRGRPKYHLKRAIIDSPSKRQLYDVSLAGR